jgi:hypothetical protein
MAVIASRNRGSSSRTTFQMSDGDSNAYWCRITLPMSRTPIQRMSACFSLDDCGIVRLASEIIRSARSTTYWARQFSANCSNVNVSVSSAMRSIATIMSSRAMRGSRAIRRPGWLPARFALAVADAGRRASSGRRGRRSRIVLTSIRSNALNRSACSASMKMSTSLSSRAMSRAVGPKR